MKFPEYVWNDRKESIDIKMFSVYTLIERIRNMEFTGQIHDKHIFTRNFLLKKTQYKYGR